MAKNIDQVFTDNDLAPLDGTERLVSRRAGVTGAFDVDAIKTYVGVQTSAVEQTYNSPGDFTPGGTTNLTMPSAAAGDDEALVHVSFNGLEQLNDGWNISGTSITFTSAIPVGVTQVSIKVLTN